jgi:GntR family transcriptional regulator
VYPETIDRFSKLPFYQQLYEILLGKIQRGEWLPGDMIPPESELIEIYEVSRNTVRQVLDILVKDGFIYRQRGRGSFVAHPTLEQSMTRIVSFTEDMHQRGFTPGTEVLSARLLPAEQQVANQLDIPVSEQLACIQRLRLADGEPMSIEESFLIHKYCPDVLNHDYAQKPLRSVLESEFGIRIASAKQVIQAMQAPSELAKLLKINPGAALLHIKRVSFSQGRIPVEYLSIHYRADRYVLFNELHE